MDFTQDTATAGCVTTDLEVAFALTKADVERVRMEREVDVTVQAFEDEGLLILRVLYQAEGLTPHVDTYSPSLEHCITAFRLLKAEAVAFQQGAVLPRHLKQMDVTSIFLHGF